MSACARCGAPVGIDSAACSASAADATPLEKLRCRDRQIAAQASLLRSVTGKLEEAATMLAEAKHAEDIDTEGLAALIDSVLEALS